MAKFSTTQGLAKKQAELDFVDIDTSKDNQLYLDPYAIQIREDEWSSQCGDHIRSFFGTLLDALRVDDRPRVTHLLSHLHEPNETFLGESKGLPDGRAWGDKKTAQLANALINSRAFETGVLSDIAEAELFIYGVGPDMISDLTTNILRGLLAEYTKAQCNLYDIPLVTVGSLGPIWSIGRRDWESHEVQLPISNYRPVLLVPKFSVRFRLSLNSQEFYNKHMIEFLRQEHLASGTGLVKTLNNGKRVVTKESVKQRHPFVKDHLADFVRSHPDILEMYKDLKGAKGPLTTDELETFFDETAFAQTLIEKLQSIPSGNDHASEYHSLAMGISTFLFYPHLIYPIKEREINDGRKRIDIKFTNASEDGFFNRMHIANQTRASSLMIECKNYSTDINNPELDQLSGRFSHRRGFLGFLLCRTIDNIARLNASCRDTAADGRGYILCFTDEELKHMLNLRVTSVSALDRFMQEKYDTIAFA